MQHNSAMHLLIPFAAPAGPDCLAAIAQLQLPHLRALLQRLTLTQKHQSKPSDLTPLHQRLQITLAGTPMHDGLTGQAARDAHTRGLANPGLPEAAQGWAWITPCHWQIHADHVHMTNPAALQLSAQESLALMQAMQGYFAEDGITLHAHTDSTWLAQGAVFNDLPTASLERVVGASVDDWINRQAQAKLLRRLQNEMQMLLYTHPLNEARAERGLPVVNSFWVSGTGTPHAHLANSSALKHDNALQTAALADNAPAWLAAWQQLDDTLMRNGLALSQSNPDFQLTLCGQNTAHTYANVRQPWWQHAQKWLQNTATSVHLQQLVSPDTLHP